jgi:hypothetical protein
MVIGDAAELAMQNRSVRLTGEMRTAVRSLAPWNDVKEVRELTERCQAAGILSS